MSKESKESKEIIYLDTIELYSSLAQIDHGLIESIQSGKQKSESQENSTKGAGDIETSLFKLVEGGIQLELTNSQSNLSSEQELVNITFNDYQLDRLLNKLGVGKLNNNSKQGDPTIENGEFEIYDFSSLASLSNDSFGSFINLLMEFANDQKDVEDDKEAKDIKTGLDILKKYGQVMTDLLPETVLLKVGNSISFLKTGCLRMSNSQLQLLSGSIRKIHVLGVIENEISNEKRELESLFEKIGDNPSLITKFVPDFIDFLLIQSQIAQKNDKLIKPVAVYF
ncbi:hypothetical protein [Lactobacillus sp. ESL0230]|uniref:DUF6414 family protein n=1 Tax=Lactobacillus sp. ESL0230 TaxID=2069353 RepID=UPI000EFC8AB4|nr:hypothetical protein [Lactobacillus sp. ESL0230]RMC46588.1 hypothetical protein F5ESL0230_04845 [Lactobacillus sp. ESL0230]